jgi:hypothetical protein
MKRTALIFVVSATIATAACKEQAPQATVPPTPIAAKPARPSRPVDAGAASDARLGMMERHAIWKAKKEAEEKIIAEERARVMKFDKSKMPKHVALQAFEQKTRQALDEAASKLNGEIDATEQLKKLAVSQRKAIDKEIDGLRTMDPQGDSSAIAADHDVILHLLATDYPRAIVSFFQGQTKPLAEVRAEMDKRESKISAWLDELKSSK